MARRRSPATKRRRRERDPLTMSDEWRVWVVENLLAGVTPNDIIATLIDSRVPERIARTEVEAILRSPSLVACQHLHRRVHRLEQLMSLQRALSAAAPDAEHVERRERIPADEFFRHYFAANRPVVVTGVVSTWPAFERWTPDYFKQHFGPVEVEVVSGRARDPDGDRKYETYRRMTTMADYVDQVLAAGDSDDIYMIARNKNMLRPELAPLFDDIEIDDSIFDPARLRGGVTLWFGPAGTVTPLHHDNTNILFCQIHGRKRVHLAAPWHSALLERARGFYSEFNLEDPGAEARLREHGVTLQCVDLSPGEALFIPAGWWHHVKALDISITFSLLNFRRSNSYEWYRPGSAS